MSLLPAVWSQEMRGRIDGTAAGATLVVWTLIGALACLVATSSEAAQR